MPAGVSPPSSSVPTWTTTTFCMVASSRKVANTESERRGTTFGGPKHLENRSFFFFFASPDVKTFQNVGLSQSSKEATKQFSAASYVFSASSRRVASVVSCRRRCADTSSVKMRDCLRNHAEKHVCGATTYGSTPITASVDARPPNVAKIGTPALSNATAAPLPKIKSHTPTVWFGGASANSSGTDLLATIVFRISSPPTSSRVTTLSARAAARRSSPSATTSLHSCPRSTSSTQIVTKGTTSLSRRP
mmetsp:Transcript_6595/g.20592  ORF Transcript_6595/g.20592 Transcript_6595/m.20592 type:complete len:248 (-) Transcript_6595:223-966(-)